MTPRTAQAGAGWRPLRALLGGSTELYLPSLYLSVGVTTVLLGTGLWYFRATERSFVDVV